MKDTKVELRHCIRNISESLHKFEDTDFIIEDILPGELSPKAYFYRTVNFKYDKFFAAPYGGIIGCIHNTSSSDLKPIDFYDNRLNHFLALFPPIEYLRSPDNIYITPEEMIICLYDNMVFVYDQRGNLITAKQVFEENNEEEKYLFSAFFEYGCFIGTSSGNIYYISDFSDLKVEKFAEFDASTLPTYAVALPPTYYPFGDEPDIKHGAVVFIPVYKDEQQKLICVQKDNVQEINFPSKIDYMEFNPSFNMVLIVCESEIFVYDYKISEGLLDLTLDDIPFIKACWCGNSTILLACEDKAVMVGISSQTITYEVEGGCFVTPEVDGARIISKDNIMYIREIQKVPLYIIKRKRNLPAVKLLFNCTEKLAQATHDTLDDLGDELSEAVDGCLEAVKFFREPEVTRSLLNVVVHSKDRVEGFNYSDFTKTVINKRTCEQISLDPCKMDLTLCQYLALGSDRLLMRLCNRCHHHLAFKIADYLNINDEFIFSNWAYSVLLSDAKNEEIISKLKQSTHVFDYVQLAKIAYDRKLNTSKFSVMAYMYNKSHNDGDQSNFVKGKDYINQVIEKEKKELSERNLSLATLLLDANSVKARSVPLLIQWEQWASAISSASKSNDTGLIAYTIKQAEKHMNNSTEIQQMVKKVLLENPVALKIWILMNPESNEISQYLIQSGLGKEAVDYEIEKNINGTEENIKKTKLLGKKYGSKFQSEIIEKAINIKKICTELQIPEKETPYQLIDYILENSPSNLRKVAKKLQLSNDEVIARKLYVGRKLSNESTPHQILIDLFNEIEPNYLEESAFVLLDYDREDLLQSLIETTINPVSKQILEDILASK